MSDTTHNWLAWQLADSAFPSGGFVHSGGLEAAFQHGEIRDAQELVSFIEATLWQAVCAGIPFVAAAHDAPSHLSDLDEHCDAFLSNHVTNRASRAQGRAFVNSAHRIFGPLKLPSAEYCHWAPIFGATLRGLALDRNTTTELFLFQWIRGLLSAAVRLGLVGPLESQALQRALTPRAHELLSIAASRTLSDLANTAPLLEIWQGAHDRLYSRLFQS